MDGSLNRVEDLNMESKHVNERTVYGKRECTSQLNLAANL